MTKPKHKQPPKNFFRYFVDEYILFRHDFEIETTLSIEDCAKALLALSETNLDDSKPRRLRASYTTVTGLSTIVYFKIIVERLNRRTYTQSAEVEGTIVASDNDTTLVTVNVPKPSILDLLLSLGFLLVMVSCGLITSNMEFIDFNHFWNAFVWIAIILVPCFTIFYWILMYSSRNYLADEIQQAIDNAEANLLKAKNEEISQSLDDSSEHQSHHAQK